MKSNFYVVEVNQTHRIVFLEDVAGPWKSITNDAENVWSHVKQNYGTLWRVVYLDTQGEWWEIVGPRTTWMGTQIGFEPWDGLAWNILKNSATTA